MAEQSKRASGLMAAGKYQEAIPLYKSLVKAVPGNPGLLLDLGLAQEMAGNVAEAIPQFVAVLKLQPDNVPALTSLGQCRLQLNQPKLALEPLEKLLALDPQNRDARGMLAGAFLSVDRLSEAAGQYRKLATIDGKDAKAWYGLGKAYEGLAANEFAQLEKTAAESGYVLALVGDSQLSRQQYRSAFFFYRQAQQKAPDLPGLHAGLAKVYSQSGHADWAQQETAREDKLPLPDCSKHRLECEVRAGKFPDAALSPASSPDDLFWSIKAYNQLALAAFEELGHLPESVEIHALKAAIFREHRQYLEAANEWKAALAVAPDNRRLQHEWAAALFQAKDYQTLLPILERAVGGGPASAETDFMLGASLLETQQPDKALPYLETAVRLDPGLQQAHVSMGLALMQLNRQEAAIPHLAKAQELDTDGSLHYQLARAYQAAGQAEKARAAMAQYQQIQRLNRNQDEQLKKEAEITAPSQ